MSRLILILTAAALIGGPAIAEENPSAPPAAAATAAVPVTPAADRDSKGVYQVFRITDNQLNCEQLISEMNNLNAAIKGKADQQAQAQNTNQTGRKIGGSVLGGALGGLARGAIARSVPGLGYVGAITAASATDAASSAVGNAVANGGSKPAAPASASDESQRLNRVSQLFAAKSC